MRRMASATKWLALGTTLALLLGTLGDAEARRSRRARRSTQRVQLQSQGQTQSPTRLQRMLRGAATQKQQQRGAVDANLDAKLSSFIQQNGLKSFTKGGKTYFATTRTTPTPDYTALGKNVVEFFVSPGFHHLYTRVGNDVYSRIGGLSKSDYRDTGSQKIGVLVELKPSEMANLNDFLARAHANPSQVLGPFNYNGGAPPLKSNCTSYITYAKVGERGETLGRVCGVWPSGMPQSFLGSLIGSNDKRIKAVVVHNPTGEFNTNYKLDLR